MTVVIVAGATAACRGKHWDRRSLRGRSQGPGAGERTQPVNGPGGNSSILL